jgi:hypothetical protein
MTRQEQETILRCSADEDHISIFTAHPPTHRKLERLGYSPWKVTTRDGEPSGWFFRVPLSEFRWRAGARKTRTLSPERIERMRAGREAGEKSPVA